MKPISSSRLYPARLEPIERARLAGEMLDNLLSISASASSETVASGLGWYRLARREARSIGRDYDLTLSASAGIISALSPRTAWLDNLKRARRLAESGESVGIGLHSSRALEIRGGARPLSILRGRKTRAFYRNIRGDLESEITLDVWMTRALLGDLTLGDRELKSLERVGAYDFLSSIVRSASIEYSRRARVVIRPAEYQALVWIRARDLSEELKRPRVRSPRASAEERAEMIREAREKLGARGDQREEMSR